MYCKQCGTKIDNNSNYCFNCGTKITPTEKEDDDDDEYKEYLTSTEEISSKESSKIVKNIIIGTIMFLILGMISIITIVSLEFEEKNNIKDNSQDEINIFYRDANNNDIEINSRTNYNSLGIDIIIIPKYDINDLSINIKQYDKNDKLIKTFKKSFGNVKANSELTTTLSLSEFDISQIFNLGGTAIEVTEGKIKIEY